MSDLLKQYEDAAAREPGGVLQRYEREDWERRFTPREPDINPRFVALGDALADSDITGSRNGAALPLRDLSGGVRSSILQASKQFYSSLDRADALAKGTEAVSIGLPLCESPIEKHILPWLVFGNWGYGRRSRITPVATSFDYPARRFVICQANVSKYRLDFLICYRLAPGKMRLVALECDGVAYHNADKDAARDKALEGMGVRTIRASGKEIYDRPWRVIARIDEAFYALGGY